MRNEEIQKASEEYAKMQKEKEELILLKEELKLLKKDPKVKRYLDICNVEHKEIPDEKEIISCSFSRVDKKDRDNDFKIYLYMGSFIYECYLNGKYEKVFFESEADFLEYKNIVDSCDLIRISPNVQEQFEKNNIVLETNSWDKETKYYELQTIYYEYLLKEDLEKSKNKILEKLKENL